jgi:hypothetical protein
MLKLTPDPKFKVDVQITVPGVEAPATVKLVFKYMGRKQMAEFIEIQKDKEIPESLAEIVLDWEGFDEKFSPENLQIFLENYPAAPLEILKAYNKQLFESRVKN